MPKIRHELWDSNKDDGGLMLKPRRPSSALDTAGQKSETSPRARQDVQTGGDLVDLFGCLGKKGENIGKNQLALT